MNIEEDQPSEIIDEEQVQLALGNKLPSYLNQVVNQRASCCGSFFPLPFERAAQRSWWDPIFDSDILEQQYRRSSNSHSTVKFRFALWYMISVSTIWLIYFLTRGLLEDLHYWQLLCGILLFLLSSLSSALFLTHTRIYHKHILTVSLSITLLISATSLAFITMVQPQPIGSFSLCIQVLVLMYTLIPLKLYMCLTIGILYSVGFELLSTLLMPSTHQQNEIAPLNAVILRLICHFAIHTVGLHIFLMSNVRKRNTFIKVGQSLVVRKQLEFEKRLKENMLHSLMPPSVANWLLHDDDNFIRRHSSDSSSDIQSLFRPFNMDHKENVSILFADIVGFTRMSTNKSAEELVEILNDIFQRFDELCKKRNCEKISTLGDCYYCVSGCPEARDDHAQCCVEMGLGMVQEIKKFDHEKNEGINIRVGVHTGTVLCGIVGTKRFKFDVWSNDVTLANRMESTGKPGMVHISEKTAEFLQDGYLLEDGESVFGMKTYFILGKRGDKTPSYSGSFREEGRQKYTNALRLFVSPPANSPSLSPQTRPRVLSCDTSPNYNKPISHNPNMLSPDVCKIKANSLPSILDIENEQDTTIPVKILEPNETTISTTSKLRKLKFPKFKRKPSSNRESAGEVIVNLELADDGIVYQEVPTIIEAISNGNKKDGSVSPIITSEPFEINEENIDIKSYISQSRCELGQFDYSPSELIRAGSNRSRYSRSPNETTFLQRASSNRSRRGRSPNFEVMEPTERSRSATVAMGSLGRPKKSFECIQVDDHQSIHSRKDSGIRSNSRSSVQELDTTLDNDFIHQHRGSGYYTCSQNSVNKPKISSLPGIEYIQKLRKQSDRQLIRCVQDNSKSRMSYFIKPPLSKVTLFFNDKQIERQFRINVHSMKNESMATLANSRFNTYLDMFVSCLVFIILSIGLLLVYGFSFLWLGTTLGFLLIQVIGVAFCFNCVVEYADQVFTCMTRFSRWNLFGAFLVMVPLIMAIINYVPNHSMSYFDLHFYTYLLFVGVVHFCNFTQLNCWMKNILATCVCLFFGILFIIYPCQEVGKQCFSYKTDLLVNIVLLLGLVWLLNREFEIDYRVSFNANYVANCDKIHVQRLKNQADYLIYNIVPEHVADALKKDAKYWENFNNVAIIFASIVNFNEMYDESFEGGKEYLRVLNELIGDFDELLDRANFQSVEKIKTIGSTFMAASGLNSKMRQQQRDPKEHLYELMDFAMEMQQVINEFNRYLLGFKLIIRIGYNFGDVTAAVIGKTKLYYDIWGDAVNIASRMDSTGVNGRIQVGENCIEMLGNKYEFEPRGYVYVKGKDHMNVYLVKKKKCPDLLSVPDL